LKAGIQPYIFVAKPKFYLLYPFYFISVV